MHCSFCAPKNCPTLLTHAAYSRVCLPSTVGCHLRRLSVSTPQHQSCLYDPVPCHVKDFRWSTDGLQTDRCTLEMQKRSETRRIMPSAYAQNSCLLRWPFMSWSSWKKVLRSRSALPLLNQPSWGSSGPASTRSSISSYHMLLITMSLIFTLQHHKGLANAI